MQYFISDGVEEMMGNANSSQFFSMQILSYILVKGQVSQITYLYSRVNLL